MGVDENLITFILTTFVFSTLPFSLEHEEDAGGIISKKVWPDIQGFSSKVLA